MLRNLRELYQYRGLLLSLTQRELKARYRGSLLGFLWTFLNPTMQMAVYSLMFSVWMRQQIEHYTFFVFIGLLPWIWFTSSVLQGTSAISDRRDLLTKVRFPAQVLPTTVVATNLVNFLLALPLLVLLGLLLGHPLRWTILLFPAVLFVQFWVTLALVYLFSAINVAFRDLQQILSNIITMWFFVTPIFYRVEVFPERFRQLLLLANPMAVMATSYQALFYDGRLPDLGPLALWMGIAVVLLWLAAGIFERRREEFAEIV
ncbi:ABC transporter permease [Hyalangium versicolor]|uniref:ABC transporter permease n=1 Tax=Hyalangium versicolor TaxID=2861190 RepID=UPI001CCCC8E0|nr:ABC transporter permease [Hyalangium versicolor]